MPKRVITEISFVPMAENKLSLPAGATILAVQARNNRPVMWVEADEKAEQETRVFRIVLNGQAMDKAGKGMAYVGTFQIENGAHTGHVYELKNRDSWEVQPDSKVMEQLARELEKFEQEGLL